MVISPKFSFKRSVLRVKKGALEGERGHIQPDNETCVIVTQCVCAKSRLFSQNRNVPHYTSNFVQIER